MMKFKFAVIDLETNGFLEFVIGGYYNGEKAVYFPSMEELMLYIFDNHQPSHPIYAHYGGIFDFLHAIDLIENIQAGEPEQLIAQGAKIIQFKWNADNENKKFIFRDFSAMFNKGLLKISESFGLKVKKGEYDHSVHKTYDDKILRNYLYRDLVSLYSAISAFSDSVNGDVKLTAASQSFSAFLPTIGGEKKLPEIDFSVNEFCRQAYYGGRVEIFRPYFDNPQKNLYYYDVNSLYPSVMINNFFPWQYKGPSTVLEKNTLGIYNAIIETPPEILIPVLPVKHKKHGLLFPTGKFEGVWTSIELKYAMEKGYKVEIIYGHTFTRKKCFHNYITQLWSERRQAQKEKNLVKADLTKLMMNSLYGRFAFNNSRENLCFNNSQENFQKKYELILKDKTVLEIGTVPAQLDVYVHYAIACFVTSYSRIKVHQILEKCGTDLFYTDTDSIVTTKKLKTSPELGELKLEKTLKRAVFLQPKSYFLEDIEGKTEQKAKGIPSKHLRFKYEDWLGAFETGKLEKISVEIPKGLRTIKDSLSRGKILLERPAYIKHLSKIYNKRHFFKNRGIIYSKPLSVD